MTRGQVKLYGPYPDESSGGYTIHVVGPGVDVWVAGMTEEEVEAKAQRVYDSTMDAQELDRD